jgi:hypothetical protein
MGKIDLKCGKEDPPALRGFAIIGEGIEVDLRALG